MQNLFLDEFSAHLKIDRKPLLFAGLLKYWNSKGPAELPPKRIFTYQHVQWMANRLEIPLHFPDRHPFNPVPLLRLSIAVGCSKKVVDSIFKCIWEEGLVGDDPDNWNSFCKAIGISVTEANELINKPEIKLELKSNGECAIAQGVFGVPTMVIDRNIFWGFDSSNLALDFLANPRLFDSPTMKRLETLPDKEKGITN